MIALIVATFFTAQHASAQSASVQHAHAQQQTAAPASVVLPTTRAAQQQQPADTTITIRSIGSDLEFLPSEIAVKQGKRLRIRYVNNGTFPHNIVVVKHDDDIDPLGIAAFNAGSTGYVPIALEERMIAYSALAAPGETIEFTFVVPPPGAYPFVCLYPGHYNMMLGTLRSMR